MANKRMPILIPDRLLISPGVWNDNKYSAKEISDCFARTDWSDKDKISLWLNHDDRNASAFVGFVRNPRLESEGRVFGDLELWDEQTATILTDAMAKFGVSAKISGREDAKTGKMSNFRFENFSIVTTPACSDAYINLSKKEDDTVSKYLISSEKEEDSPVLESDLTTDVRRLKEMGNEEEKKEETVEEVKEEEEVEEVKENSKELLETLNAKFDKLIALLSKKELNEDEPAEAVEEEAETEEEEVEESAPEESEELSKDKKELAEVKKELAEIKEKLNKPKSKTAVKVLSSNTVGNDLQFNENLFCDFLGTVESPMRII